MHVIKLIRYKPILAFLRGDSSGAVGQLSLLLSGRILTPNGDSAVDK